MRVNIGQPAIFGSFEHYALHFDLLEIAAEPGRLPRPASLRQWARQAPEGFVFSIAVPAVVAALDTNEPEPAALDFALSAADALGSKWWLIATPSNVTPGRLSRQRLRSLAERLVATGRNVAWDPHGPWAPEQAESFAAEVGITLVRDAARSALPKGAEVYTRLRTFASGGRVRASAISRAAERLAGHELVLVVLEGKGASQAARWLREEMGRATGDLETTGRFEEQIEAPEDEQP